jgi:hypothetical protein
MAKAWFCLLAALIALLAIGPHPSFNPTLPIIAILAAAFIRLMWMVSSPLPSGTNSTGGDSFYAGGSFGGDSGSMGGCDGGGSCS